MFGSAVLEIALGLVFLYFFFSTICSAIYEAISQILQMRGRQLETTIKQMLNDPELAAAFFGHPLIEPLAKNESKPSYIEPGTFSRVLVDILAPTGVHTFSTLHQAVTAENTTGVRKAVGALTRGIPLPQETGGDDQLESLLKNIENWYNDTMNRASAWYKQKSRYCLFGIALLVSVIFNADTLAIVDSLSSDPTLRAVVVSLAQKRAEEAPPSSDLAISYSQINQLRGELQPLRLPLGWSSGDLASETAMSVFDKFVGLLLTTLALTMGAPFWFDVLNKLVNIRSAGERPDTTAQR
jgi:hypothetical protein